MLDLLASPLRESWTLLTDLGDSWGPIPAPEIVVDVDPAFGTVSQGAALPTVTGTVSNIGDEVLNVSSAMDAGDFELLDSVPPTINPGEVWGFTVRLKSTATAGVKSGVLTITSNDSDEPTTAVTFTARVGLTSSPALVLAQYLVNEGTANPPGGNDVVWPVYVSHTPNKPDDLIGIYLTPGVVGGRWMRTGRKVAFPGVMIRVRAFDDAAGYDKANQIAELLDSTVGRPEVTMESGEVIRIDNLSRSSSVSYAGLDEEGRRIYYTVNARLTLTPLTP